MPKIHAVRIAGLKYNKMEKQYHDTLFEFHDEKTATNALISFMNAGGKGVLLQTLFQIIKPGTAWGEKDNRLYKQFFFNKNHKFIPYTFHVIIGWELDGDGKKYLLTGGVFSARKQSMEEDEKSYKIEPDFLFYTKAHNNINESIIKEIPVYNETNSKTANELEAWLKINGFDTYKRLKRHREKLKSYGINPKDWDVQKKINKAEGGVQKFFEGAETDYNLFRKKIIPTISDSLKADKSADDLVEIFKSQASIARNLPILLSREAAHYRLLEDFTPLELALKRAIEIDGHIETNLVKGIRLFKAIQHELAIQQDYLQDAEKAERELSERKKQLLFDKDNIEHEEINRLITRLESDLEAKNNKLNHINQQIDKSEKEKDNYSFQIVLKEWSEVQQLIDSYMAKISIIETQDGQKELEAELVDTKRLLSAEWQRVSEELSVVIAQYNHLLKRLQQALEEFDDNKDKYRNEKAELNIRYGTLTKEQANFRSLELERVEHFGEAILFDLDQVAKEIETEREKADSDKKKNEEVLEQYNKQWSMLHEEEIEITTKYEQNESLNKDLEEKIKLQLDKERKLETKICSFLQIEPQESFVSWLRNARVQIEHHVEDMKQGLDKEKETYWQKQIDASLNQEDYWIANRDLKEIKEQLSADAEVLYGSEFLSAVSLEQREEEINKHPLLPFGLIVSREDFIKIEDKLFDRVFQSPVPLFIREKMINETKTAFKLYSGNSNQFILNDGKLPKWKEDIKDTLKESKEIISEYESSVKQANDLENAIDVMLAQDTSQVLTKRKEELEFQMAAWDRRLNELRTRLDQLEKMKSEASRNIEILGKKINKLEEAGKLLSSYKVATAEEKVRQEELEKTKQRKLIVDEEFDKITGSIKNKTDQKLKWEKEFRDWEFGADKVIENVRNVLLDVTFPAAKDDVEPDEIPDLNVGILNKLNQLYESYRGLQKTQEERSQGLVLLRHKLNEENKKRTGLEKELDKLHSDWQKMEIPTFPLELLRDKQENAGLLIKENDRERQEEEKNAISISTEIKVETKNLRAAAKNIEIKHQRKPEAVFDDDLLQKRHQIRIMIDKNSGEIKEIEKIYAETNIEVQRLENFKGILDSHLTKESKEISFERSDLDSIKKDTQATITQWTYDTKSLRELKEAQFKKVDIELRQLIRMIEETDWDNYLKSNVLSSLNHANIRAYEHVLTIISGIKNFSRNSLEKMEEEKINAQQAQAFWASRAAMKVVKIAEVIRNMLGKMRIKNDSGNFPLIRLDEDILLKKPEDVESLLQDHFLSSIKKITDSYVDIDDSNKELNDKIRQMVGDEEILFVALRRKFPVLLVYNMQTNNAFMYGRPLKAYYSTWQTMNEGSEEESDGSGGQKLSARMIVMMMLLSMKGEEESRWSPLIVDNPFGQAASEHILDPIFAVAEKLKFQLIIVTPPELVKTEISQRFPVYYKLDFKNIGGKEVINQVKFSFRQY